MHDDTIPAHTPADNPQDFLRRIVGELVGLVASELIEKVHEAYPNLNIDTCDGQVLAIVTRCLTSGRTFGERVLDQVAATLNLPTIV